MEHTDTYTKRSINAFYNIYYIYRRGIYSLSLSIRTYPNSLHKKLLVQVLASKAIKKLNVYTYYIYTTRPRFPRNSKATINNEVTLFNPRQSLAARKDEEETYISAG